MELIGVTVWGLPGPVLTILKLSFFKSVRAVGGGGFRVYSWPKGLKAYENKGPAHGICFAGYGLGFGVAGGPLHALGYRVLGLASSWIGFDQIFAAQRAILLGHLEDSSSMSVVCFLRGICRCHTV